MDSNINYATSSNGPRPKRFHCKVIGCGKSFTRSTHLRRHSLNHNDACFKCSRCGAAFQRKDLLGRHVARHSVKDSDAGGIGLGVLDTKLRHFPSRSSTSSLRVGEQQVGLTTTDWLSERSNANGLLEANQNARCESSLPGEVAEGLQLDNERNAEISNTQESDSLAVVDFPELSHSVGLYHDQAFDFIHLDLTGPYSRQPKDTLSGFSSLLASEVTFNDPGINNCSSNPAEPEIQFQSRAGDSAEQDRARNLFRTAISSTASQSLPTPECISEAVSEKTLPAISVIPPRNMVITPGKRNQIFAFLEEIQPVKPDGSIIDQTCEQLQLNAMQMYANLFFRCYNRPYPIIHEPTMDLSTVEVLLLFSIILLGATYHGKEAHQVSVYLYDAIIPQVLADLVSRPIFDISTLQAFLILENYGMYRGGPHQRENAILVHSLLLSAIRRISRYHVRARITLPTQLKPKDRDWYEFAHVEQYKRLILFFFLWDTQNVSLYSFMPSMSTQTVQVEIPCSEHLWNARSASQWKTALEEETFADVPTLPRLVSAFVEDDLSLTTSINLDKFTIILVLHGLMSMCNDMLHFDNRSIYLIAGEDDVEDWSPWRRQMSAALDSWRAKFDAFSIVANTESTTDGRKKRDRRITLQYDSVYILALFHLAHITISAELRHLQVAAGAQAIFGHMVSPSDLDESRAWATMWVATKPASANHAVWHAAQCIRDGLLGLEAWDSSGLIHYPWCLYISTLTIWAYLTFSANGEDHDPTRLPSNCDLVNGQRKCVTNSVKSMSHTISVLATNGSQKSQASLKNCCVHGVATEVAKSLKTVRWTAAFEAMKILENLARQN